MKRTAMLLWAILVLVAFDPVQPPITAEPPPSAFARTYQSVLTGWPYDLSAEPINGRYVASDAADRAFYLMPDGRIVQSGGVRTVFALHLQRSVP